MAKGNAKSVVFAIMAIPVGILAFLTSLSTLDYFYTSHVTLEGWLVHVLLTGFFVGLFVLLMWKRPRTMQPPTEDDETLP